MKNNGFFIFLVLSILILFTNCSSQKKVAYFRTVDATTTDSINKYFNTIHEAKICSGDMLSITISALDPIAAAPFNLPFVGYSSPNSEVVSSTPSLQSYLVDINGNVTMPVIGQVKLVGLTKSQAIAEIQGKLSPYLQNAIVTIKFLNYKITVIGEVLRPGQYTIDNERVTVLDALGLAGDMTIYGKRNNVLLIRENNGIPGFVRLNMNSDELFKSPYYYLQQNDVLYVEPNSTRIVNAQNVPLYLQSITTAATLATTITTIILLYQK